MEVALEMAEQGDSAKLDWLEAKLAAKKKAPAARALNTMEAALAAAEAGDAAMLDWLEAQLSRSEQMDAALAAAERGDESMLAWLEANLARVPTPPPRALDAMDAALAAAERGDESMLAWLEAQLAITSQSAAEGDVADEPPLRPTRCKEALAPPPLLARPSSGWGVQVEPTGRQEQHSMDADGVGDGHRSGGGGGGPAR
eukprot:2088729-Prymnesium_polylepis.1